MTVDIGEVHQAHLAGRQDTRGSWLNDAATLLRVIPAKARNPLCVSYKKRRMDYRARGHAGMARLISRWENYDRAVGRIAMRRMPAARKSRAMNHDEIWFVLTLLVNAAPYMRRIRMRPVRAYVKLTARGARKFESKKRRHGHTPVERNVRRNA